MQMDLYELLRERPIIHPTRIGGFVGSGNELQLSIRGYPWWKPDAKDAVEEEIAFLFKGISESLIHLDDFFAPNDDEALENFDVSLLTDHSWAQPSAFSIYCNGPLLDPSRLFAKVEEYLQRAQSYKTAQDFLNMNGGSLERFQSITASSSYFIAQAPDSIRQIICDELERQAVPFSVLTGRSRNDGKYLVRVGSSAFACEEAIAKFL